MAWHTRTTKFKRAGRTREAGSVEEIGKARRAGIVRLVRDGAKGPRESCPGAAASEAIDSVDASPVVMAGRRAAGVAINLANGASEILGTDALVGEEAAGASGTVLAGIDAVLAVQGGVVSVREPIGVINVVAEFVEIGREGSDWKHPEFGGNGPSERIVRKVNLVRNLPLS